MTLDSGIADFEIDPEWIGRTESRSDIVTSELLRRYRATFDQEGTDPSLGDPVPRLLHFCLAQSAARARELGADGHPRKGGFLPPIPLPRRMWAGGVLEFQGDLRVGDTVTRNSRVADVTKKTGKTGALAFVVVEHLLQVGNRTVVRERQDIVYRGMGSFKGPTKSVAAVGAGRYRRAVETPTVLLFRYSALTFNGHLIHYDRQYAEHVEGYPGLVVHGPLQAALLMNFATELGGSAPSSFSFRSASPIFDRDGFELHADWAGETLRLWTGRAGGPLAMSAEARWS